MRDSDSKVLALACPVAVARGAGAEAVAGVAAPPVPLGGGVLESPPSVSASVGPAFTRLFGLMRGRDPSVDYRTALHVCHRALLAWREGDRGAFGHVWFRCSSKHVVPLFLDWVAEEGLHV
jgi:hypothetical protein